MGAEAASGSAEPVPKGKIIRAVTMGETQEKLDPSMFTLN